MGSVKKSRVHLKLERVKKIATKENVVYEISHAQGLTMYMISAINFTMG